MIARLLKYMTYVKLVVEDECPVLIGLFCCEFVKKSFDWLGYMHDETPFVKKLILQL